MSHPTKEIKLSEEDKPNTTAIYIIIIVNFFMLQMMLVIFSQQLPYKSQSLLFLHIDTQLPESALDELMVKLSGVGNQSADAGWPNRHNANVLYTVR